MLKNVLVVASVLQFCHITSTNCCDLEQYFSEKQVSVEDSAKESKLIFRGLTIATTTPSYFENNNDVRDVFTAYFEFINTYKGSESLNGWVTNNNRQINVTIESRPSLATKCSQADEVPREYIIFCNVIKDEIRAVSIAKWDEATDQRVWSSLGWSKWSDWSACSVSCSAGIQQRSRHCLLSNCPGFNVEQRHCNLFGCAETVNPLALEEGRFFHPSKDRWQTVPDRPTAWRLKPNSYIWIPSTQLFTDTKESRSRPFPREFALFITLRLHNDTMGTIFSLRSRRRQDTYLSLEVAGSDLKLIHAASNGTDVVRIPTQLNDGHWHQIAISIRDDSVVDSYVECEWSRTDILRSHTLDIPEDSDLIIGYLFSGDLEQLSIVTEPSFVSLHCTTVRTPIIDMNVKDTNNNNKNLNRKIQSKFQRNEPHIVIKKHRISTENNDN